MKKYDLVYQALLDALKHISDSQDTEDYALAATASGKESEYTSLIERIQQLVVQLEDARNKKEISSLFPDIHDLIKEFGTNFPDFPDLKLEKLLLQILLRKKIIDGEIALGESSFNEDDVAHDEYIVMRLDEDINQVLFENYNSTDAFHSAVFFSLVDYGLLRKNIEDTPLNLAFSYKFLHSVDQADIALNSQYTITKKVTPPADPSVVAAFIKLLIVGKGLRFRDVHTHTGPPAVFKYEQIRLNEDYRQHIDIINILNEYNNRSELLTKYLTVYQIIENFMYKTAIVSLESSAGGRIFSIRDFRKLYRQVDLKEFDALKRLFRNTFQESLNSGVTFKSLAQSEWRVAVTNITAAEIDKILDQMAVSRSDGTIITHLDIDRYPDNFEMYMARLVYSMRNSIVHNTETEFHLTNFTLTPSIQKLMELFLLPLLERLVFSLISTKNSHVWYTNRQISLY